MRKQIILAIFSFLTLSVQAQERCPEMLPGAADRLMKDIGYLASDELGGRYPGTKGIRMAKEYIEQEFKKMKLRPMGEGGFEQEFSIPMSVEFNSANALLVQGQEYQLPLDYYPTQYSSNGNAEGQTVYVKYGITAPEKKYDDYKKLKPSRLEGKIFVMDVSSPDGIHPHSDYLKYHDLGERVKLAKEKGAQAVILINLEGSANDIAPEFRSIHEKGLPVIFVTNNELAGDLKKRSEVALMTHLETKKVKAYNIVGFKNNEAEHTIIIGAHYDHLGMGGKNSLSANKEPQVHNGADDNASGVAGMLEIARNISGGKTDYSRYNYIFIAFSGEEMGLLGSAFYTDQLEDAAQRFRYMLNLDMVGRLEDNLLAVNGVGTATQWKEIIEATRCDELKVKTSESGVGPSDHTNFYYLNLPVLHFFTGTHSDYHKPSDDLEKINIKGEVQVVRYILGIILNSQLFEEMEFTPTKEASQMVPKFTVTLGVMPDYMFDGEGMRIDGVTEDRPADKAGLQPGDVVTKLGEVKVVDMMSYMKALGQFKKGDEAQIEFSRNGETMKSNVKF